MVMPIPLSCNCGRAPRVKDELAGRKVRCPQCSAVLVVLPSTPPDDEEIGLLPLEDSEPPRKADEDEKPKPYEMMQSATRSSQLAEHEEDQDEQDTPEARRRERR